MYEYEIEEAIMKKKSKLRGTRIFIGHVTLCEKGERKKQ